jgi:hypothetical protein
MKPSDLRNVCRERMRRVTRQKAARQPFHALGFTALRPGSDAQRFGLGCEVCARELAGVPVEELEGEGRVVRCERGARRIEKGELFAERGGVRKGGRSRRVGSCSARGSG